MTCDQRNMFKATFHKHNIQTLLHSHKPTTTINHSSLYWEKNPHPQLKMLQTATTVKCKHTVLIFSSTSVPFRGVYDTPRLQAGQRAGLSLSGTAASEEENFSGYSRWTPAGEKQPASPTLSPSLLRTQTVQLFSFTTRPKNKTASWWVLL